MTSSDIKSRSFKKTKKDEDFTGTVKAVYSLLSMKYGYTARISDMFLLLKEAFGLQEFELLDPRLCENGQFESYLIDRLIDWQAGKEIDFSDIYRAILEVGDFTGTEKEMFYTGDIEERLWAIYLVVCEPSRNDLLN